MHHNIFNPEQFSPFGDPQQDRMAKQKKKKKETSAARFEQTRNSMFPAILPAKNCFAKFTELIRH